MTPYRTSAEPHRWQRRTPVTHVEGVLPWMALLIGGGRVFQALWYRETWGAEATLCLALVLFGGVELARGFRAFWRSR